MDCWLAKFHLSFPAIVKAYAVLSDPEKRSRYDQFGEDGLNLRTTRTSRGYDPEFDADELFRAFFGDSFGFGGNHSELISVKLKLASHPGSSPCRKTWGGAWIRG